MLLCTKRGLLGTNGGLESKQIWITRDVQTIVSFLLRIEVVLFEESARIIFFINFSMLASS